MLPLLYLFFLVGISCSYAESNNKPMMNNFYQRWINNSIVSPFLTAYTTLNKQIIEKIMLVNPNSDENTIKSLINSLQCRFETIPKQLRQASDASERIRRSLEHEEKVLLRKISRHEALVHSKEKDVNQTKTNLDDAEKKMKLDETAMNNYQQSVNAAQRNVDRAQQTVDKSDTCRRKRRKKRFLSFLCDMFGGKGTQNAHERLSMAVHNKHSVQHRLQFQQQLLKNQRFRYQTAQSQLNAATAELQTLQSKLNQTQTSFKNMAELTKEFKDVETYLKEVLGSSNTFKEQLMDLMDFENVIDPLNDIYQQMINNKFINLNSIKKSTEITQPTSESLKKVKEIITTWSVVIPDEDEMSVPCMLLEDD